LGIAFQLVDDLLDYEGNPALTGKNVGDDLAEGKPTLPLIHVMREGTTAQASLVRAAIESKNKDQLPAILEAVRACGSLDYTRNAAERCRDAALQSFAVLPASEARLALETLAHRAVKRDH
ncbi:MAG: octaprenyl-diphosphate synthase, partial [Halieaceae bacterium]